MGAKDIIKRFEPPENKKPILDWETKNATGQKMMNSMAKKIEEAKAKAKREEEEEERRKKKAMENAVKQKLR